MNGRALRWLASLAHRPRADGAGPTLTIVRHHRVYADGERPLYRLGVSESVLDAQLAMLRAAGKIPMTVSEGLRFLEAGRPGHAVALSFDDGYADNVTRALPLLESHGARATFYLTAGLIEERRAPWWDVLAHALERASRPRARVELDGAALELDAGSPAGRARSLAALLPRMRTAPGEQAERLAAVRAALDARGDAPCALATWDEAARLAAAGMEVGAHTLSHPFLSLLGEDGQRAEIEGSMRLIEARLGVRPRGLAYPGGDLGSGTAALAAAAGLEHAVTTRAGDNGTPAARFGLRRRGLSEGACLGPDGRFSASLARAELDGAFDRWRGAGAAP